MRIALFSSFLSPFHKYRRKATTKDLIISLFDSERCVHAGTVIAIPMQSSSQMARFATVFAEKSQNAWRLSSPDPHTNKSTALKINYDVKQTFRKPETRQAGNVRWHSQIEHRESFSRGGKAGWKGDLEKERSSK